jgi:polysaccharide export outer membrane protein
MPPVPHPITQYPWVSSIAGALAMVVIQSAGCAGLPQAPAFPSGASGPAALGLADDRPPDGSLRPEDEVLVETGTAEPRRQVRARVDARGQLHVDSGRDVPVAGLSVARAEAMVTQAVRRTDKHAEVSLQIERRPTDRITVLGAVVRPGFLEITPAMRVADLVAAAGGILQQAAGDVGASPVDIADLDRAALVRKGTALPINMRDALRAKPGHNVYVHPGDLLYVPFATDRRVSVLGQVNAVRVMAHHPGMRLTEALVLAGGLTPGADKGDIRVVRGPVEAPLVYQASLSDIAEGEQSDATLLPGDVVFVEDHWVEDLGEVFGLVSPIVGGLTAFLLSVLVIESASE